MSLLPELMLELYEKTMPDYEFTSYEGFRIRAHRGEVGQRAGERYLQPVQYPGDSKGGHDPRMKWAPAQAVETRGNVCRDDPVLRFLQ